MPRLSKARQFYGLLGAAALLVTSSAAHALSEESTASKIFRQTVNTMIAIPSLVITKTLDVTLTGSTGWHRKKFFELVEASGYELKKADATTGLIPEIKLVYEQSRQLSEGDREVLEEEIKEFEEEDPTWIEGKLEARILRNLLAASEGTEFRIGEFDINILPIPGFTFSTMPAEFNYTPDTILIMRRMREMRDQASHEANSKRK